VRLNLLLTWEQRRPRGMMGLFKLHPCQEAVMTSIPQALQRIKANVENALPESTVRRLVADVPRAYHNRTLTPVVTTYLFLQQILHGNTAVGQLRHHSGLDFTDSAYCQARQRLPVGFFRRLHQAVLAPCRLWADRDRATRWHGHRVYGLDGSSFSMPDTEELRQEFGQPPGQAEGCGFPTAHLLVQFDLGDGFLLRAVAAPWRTHDLRHAAVMHQDLGAGDLVLGDRAFCSYAHLALCVRRGLHGLFRAHQRLIISFRPRRRHAGPAKAGPAEAGLPRSRWLTKLGKDDQVVEYFKPKDKPAWMTAPEYAALPESVVVRELRFAVRVPGRRTRVVTVVTTLLDPEKYPAKDLARLYEKRWQVEVNLRHLKQTLGMDVLRCRTYPGVMKELLMFVVAYNLVRRVMAEAARRQGVAAERVSFVDALRWLRQAKPGEAMPRLRVNRERAGRYEPRVRKRRPKQYSLMRKPRAVLRAALLNQAPAEQEHAA
jgi:Transposase DDE domain